MTRLLAFIVVGALVAAVTLVVGRRRVTRSHTVPAPVSAPVHMAVGDAAPDALIPDDDDSGV